MFLIDQTGREPSWISIKKMVDWKDKVLHEKIMEIDIINKNPNKKQTHAHTLNPTMVLL